MLHWTAGRFASAREIGTGQVRDLLARPTTTAVVSRRAEHARMLEHAAVRRRRAAVGDERAYWRACAPAAVVRAARLRGEAGFARLP